MTNANKKRTALGKRIEKLRGSLTQAQFAKLVKVKQNVISRWENGEAKPTGQGYVRLGNIARDYEDKKWFWEQAGMNLNALDNFIDMRMAGEKAATSVFIEIAPLDGGTQEKVSFAASLLHSPASTRFVVLRGEQYPFKEGDIVLVDSSDADLSVLEEGALVAVSGPHDHRGHYIGQLLKHPAHSGASQTLYLLEHAAHGKDLVIGSSSGKGPIQSPYAILGRVVAWMHQGHPVRHPSDQHLILRSGKIPAELWLGDKKKK